MAQNSGTTMKYWTDSNYPSIVCLDCLEEARKDTFKLYGFKLSWGGAYSVYKDKCQVCGDIKECTEPRDVNYPTFELVLKRLRKKKINKIKDNINE